MHFIEKLQVSEAKSFETHTEAINYWYHIIMLLIKPMTFRFLGYCKLTDWARDIAIIANHAAAVEGPNYQANHWTVPIFASWAMPSCQTDALFLCVLALLACIAYTKDTRTSYHLIITFFELDCMYVPSFLWNTRAITCRLVLILYRTSKYSFR